MMSESRRNRRKKQKSKKGAKSNITGKDKVFGILAVVVLFLLAGALVIFVALSKG